MKNYLVKVTIFDGTNEYGEEWLIKAEPGQEEKVANAKIKENWGLEDSDHMEESDTQTEGWEINNGDRIAQIDEILGVTDQDYLVLKKYIYEA